MPLPIPSLPKKISTSVFNALMRTATAALTRVPHRPALFAARCAADLATRIGVRRHPMRLNLDLVFGDARSDADKRRIARSAMRNLFLTAVESVRLSHPRARDEIADCVRLEPAALLDDLASDARPLLLAVAHSGNFDLAGFAFGRRTGRSVAVVMKQTQSRTSTRLLVQGREALGFRVLGTWDSAVLRHAIRHLRSGGVLCMLPDQYARRMGVVLPFMGQPASTHSGPAFAALKAPGTRVVVAVDTRVEDGAHHVCHFEEIEGFAASGDTRADVAALTLRINDVMSRMLEKAPESYLWQHRRWRIPGWLRKQLHGTSAVQQWVTPPRKRSASKRTDAARDAREPRSEP